ncbi:MAG: glycosyltransferase family 2 protein [Planctomycetota bacterium]
MDAATPQQAVGSTTQALSPAPTTESTTVPTVVPQLRRGRRVEDLTVVIPAKNEVRTIACVVEDVRTQIAALGIVGEVLVVDDGSDDNTGPCATEHGARVVRNAKSMGNGAAIKRGIREANHSWILLMDADGQHPAHTLKEMVDRIEDGHDMVVASRDGRGGSLHRNFANRLYNRLASYVTERRIPDLTSGFRIVRADIAKALVYLLPNKFSYPTTITLSMIRCGYSVDFVPFLVRPREGKSHIRLFSDGMRFLLIIVKIATFFAPLRVFLPLAAMMFLTGLGWYGYTYATEQRFTNMAALLMTQASVIFGLGLVSEQVASLRFEKLEDSLNR